MYRAKPSTWVEHKINIDLTPYRSRDEIEGWLAGQPRESHTWLRQQLQRSDFLLDSSRSYLGDALDLSAEPGQYALQWANGCGKTVFAALKLHHFLDCYPGGIALTTAGTWSQLKEQLWREIAHWAGAATADIAANCAPRGIGKTQIDLAPDWAAFGRASDKPETFEGVHADAVLLLIDEAKAVPPGIFEAARRILRGNPRARFWFVCISSPGSPTGPFWDITNGDQAHRWTTLRCSAYQSPRVSLEQIQVDSMDLGEDAPLFVAMNLGEFPAESEDTVIPLSHAQAAVGRVVSEEGWKTLGIDVARKGRDRTALVPLIGRCVYPAITRQGKRTTWTEGKAIELHGIYEFDAIGVDDTGVGGGVSDTLVNEHMPVVEVNFGATDLVEQPDRYVNNKAEMYFVLASEFEAGFHDPENPNVGLSLPEGAEGKRMVHQLTMQEYSYDNRYRKVLESHKALKDRGEPSPDEADGIALANFARRGAHSSGLSFAGSSY